MKTQFMYFTLAASIGLALAFTVSCSSDDDGGGGSSSSNGGGEQPSSSSGTEISSVVGSSSSNRSSSGGSSSSVARSSSSNRSSSGGSSSSNGTEDSSSSNGGGGSSSSNGTEDSSSSNGGGGSSSSNGTGGSSSSNGSKTYKTVEIGTQTWMAENLNEAVGGSKCYKNSEANCDKYGRLYNWSTARTVCPSGWHLPSRDEWDALAAYIGSAKHLKATSGWNSSGNGLDTYGFSALPGGIGYPDGYFHYAGDHGYWWSASEYDSDLAYSWYMYYFSENALWSSYDKSLLSSVRCVKD